MTNPNLPLYFTGSISANDTTYLPVRKAIVRAMQEYGCVLDDHVARDNALAIADEMKKKGINIYAHDTGLTDLAIAGVAEISTATTGGGGEIERLATQGKPLLVLHHQDTRGSWYVNDMPAVLPNVTHKTYATQEEAVALTREFLEKIPRKPFTGKFIVIDGPDYCGKGTQHRMLVSYLLDHPQDRDQKLMNVVATREPFNTHYQKEIRKILKESMDPRAKAERLAELFVNDRKIHIATTIIPDVAKGFVVVSDRYKYSTEAYQSAQGLDLDTLIGMHRGMPVPDVTFFIKVSLEERMRRKAAARERPYEEIFDKDKDFQQQLDRQYEALVEKHKDEKIIVVDGNRPKEDVFHTIKNYVDLLLRQEKNKE